MVKLKLYLETSVWNFYYADDAPEKKEVTRRFFHNLSDSGFNVYISHVVYREIGQAEEEKRQKLLSLINLYAPVDLEPETDIEALANQYIQQKALPSKSIEDALHIAFSTVYELDYVVSWNMKHIANVNKQRKVQIVNLSNGYTKPLQLITPFEVSEDDDNDES